MLKNFKFKKTAVKWAEKVTPEQFSLILKCYSRPFIEPYGKPLLLKHIKIRQLSKNAANPSPFRL